MCPSPGPVRHWTSASSPLGPSVDVRRGLSSPRSYQLEGRNREFRLASKEEARVHTGGGKTWDIPPPPPPKLFPPLQEFSQPKFQHYSRMFCACDIHFRMAISTSRMPQNLSQSFYFSKTFWKACPQTLVGVC